MPDLNSLFQSEGDALDPPFVQSHAFLIGIDAYEHISPLRTAVKDATDISEILADVDKHAYQVHLFKNATKQNMEECFALMQQEVKAEDRVIFYFAGHGIAMDSESDPEGFLVPADAKSDDKETLIKMDRLHEVLTALPCKHGLLVLDCCFAGSFKWSSGTRSEIFDFGQTLYAERFWRYVEHPAWQVITSSAHDQKAADLLDQQALGLRDEELTDTHNSPFAWAFKQAIDLHSKADTRGHRRSDGIVTTTELFLYLQDVVLAASQNAKRQSPALFTLGSKHDTKGEYIFLNPGHPLNLESAPSKNPYKGLMPYKQTDASDFFGRKTAVENLVQKLENTSLLIVSAPSGQGKSSLILAGLLPYLEKEQEYTRFYQIRPTHDPYYQIQSLPQFEPESKSVLVIDQYEEFFTNADYDKTHEKFENQLIKLLKATKKNYDGFKIIITIRSDFEWELKRSRFGQSFWQDSNIRQFLYRLAPMSFEELRQVLVMPLWVNAYDFESEEMLDQILEEINYAPGALALLSFTMQQLYLLRDIDKRVISEEAYRKQLGGVNGALSKHADKIYDNMPSAEHRLIMQKLMLRMVRLNDGSYSRRRVYTQLKAGANTIGLNELDYPDQLDQTVAEVIQIFADQILILSDEDEIGTYIEPIHDSLINFWPRCLAWIQAFGRENLVLQRQLWSGVLEWKMPAKPTDQKVSDFIEGGTENKGLWDTHPKLSQVIQSIIVGVNPQLLRDDKSTLWRELMALTTQLEPTERTQVSQLLKQWRNEEKIPQLDAFIFSGASSDLFEILLTNNEHWLNQEEVSFVKQSWEAKIADVIQLKRERDEARALLLSIKGKYLIKENPVLGLKLLKTACQKVEKNPPGQLTQNIVDTFYGQLRKIPVQTFSITTERPIKQILVSDFSNGLFSFLEDGTVQNWYRKGELKSTWPIKVVIKKAVFLPRHRKILVLSSANFLKIYSFKGDLSKDYSETLGKQESIQLSKDGRFLLTIGLDKKARIWNLKEEKWETFVEENVHMAVLSPKGKSIFVSFGDHAYIRQLSEQSPQYLRGDRQESQGEGINSAVFSKDGKSLLTGDNAGRTIIWSLKGVPNLDAKSAEHPIVEVKFGSKMEYYLAITEANNNRTLLVFNKNHERIARISTPQSILSAQVCPQYYEEDNLLTLSADGSIQFWNLYGEATGVGTAHTPIHFVYFEPDRNLIISLNGENEIIGWEMSLFPESDNFRPHRPKREQPTVSPTAALDKVIKDAGYASFAPSQKYLATISQDQTNLRLWDLNGEQLLVLNNPKKFISLDFSTDSNYFLTEQADENPAQLWSRDGTLIASIGQNLRSIFFTQDGESIYVYDEKIEELGPILWPSPKRLFRLLMQELSLPDWTESEISQYGVS